MTPKLEDSSGRKSSTRESVENTALYFQRPMNNAETTTTTTTTTTTPFTTKQQQKPEGRGQGMQSSNNANKGGGGGGGIYSVKPKWLVSQSSAGHSTTKSPFQQRSSKFGSFIATFRSSKFGSLHDLNVSDCSFSSRTTDDDGDDDDNYDEFGGDRQSSRMSRQQQFQQQQEESDVQAFVNARVNTWWYNMETIAMNIADAWNGHEEDGEHDDASQQQQAQLEEADPQRTNPKGNPQESSDHFARLTY